MVKGRQHMHSLCVCMICLNHRDELDRSILDLYSGRKVILSLLYMDNMLLLCSHSILCSVMVVWYCKFFCSYMYNVMQKFIREGAVLCIITVHLRISVQSRHDYNVSRDRCVQRACVNVSQNLGETIPVQHAHGYTRVDV